MKTELKNVSPCIIELNLTMAAEEALKDYKQVLMKFKNYVNIPGFRKGKAPAQMVESQYGEYAKQEFYDQKLNEYYKMALKKNELNPISEAEISKIDWEKGKDLTAIFRFEIMPEIKIKKYKELEIPYQKIEFSENMIDEMIGKIRRENATEVDADSPIKVNDLVKITIFLKDETDRDIKRFIEVGTNQYSVKFNKDLLGKEIGAEFKSILFEKESNDEEIDSRFVNTELPIRIDSIKRRLLPQIDDEFAKDAEYDSLAEMQQELEKNIRTQIKIQNKRVLRGALIDKLLQENPLDVPPSMIKKQAEEMVKEYAKGDKQKLEEFSKMYYQTAENDIKKVLLVNKLIQEENIEISVEDKEEIIREAAGNMHTEVEKYKDMYKKQIESKDFEFSIKEEKLLDLIEQNSKFVPPEQEENTDEKEENIDQK